MHGMLSRKLVITMAVAIGALCAGACGSDSGSVGPTAEKTQQLTNGTGTGGTDSSTNHSNPTSNGPVVRVVVAPSLFTTSVGNWFGLMATGYDAAGVRVANTKATWRSSDANIIVVSDTGVFYAKAMGTAKAYGTINGIADSAFVTVGAQQQQGGQLPPTVASFDLSFTVRGAVVGSDTSRTVPVAGASVTLSRIGGVTGDTLATPIAAGSGQSDANGVVKFTGLAGGSYSLTIVPPPGSGYLSVKSGFGPPRGTPLNMLYVLFRQ